MKFSLSICTCICSLIDQGSILYYIYIYSVYFIIEQTVEIAFPDFYVIIQ